MITEAVAKRGTKVVYDSMRGLIECKLVAAMPDEDLKRSGTNRLTMVLEVVEDAPCYPKGLRLHASESQVVPKRNVRYSAYNTYITPVKWSLP